MFNLLAGNSRSYIIVRLIYFGIVQYNGHIVYIGSVIKPAVSLDNNNHKYVLWFIVAALVLTLTSQRIL